MSVGNKPQMLLRLVLCEVYGMLRYCALFSGSGGNSTYIGTANGGLLIDAGVSAKRIETALYQRCVDPRSIRAVLVTHEHSDHIAGLRVLCKRYGWPLIASNGTLSAMVEGNKIDACHRLYCIQDGQTVTIGAMEITAFATPHDSRESMGYRIASDDGKSIAVATDMGYITPTVTAAISGADLVHIESNHDLTMLRNGPYPYPLKRRIEGEGGHLSNCACAQVLPQLLQSGTTRFVLAHLSEENNLPMLARRTSVESLSAVGATEGNDYLLDVASPIGEQPLTYL